MTASEIVAPGRTWGFAREKYGVRLGFLILFSALYAVQGIVVAYLFNFNKSYMKSFGLREDTIGGIQTLALLPLALKFLLGPVSDRFNLFGFGHRLPYILIGLLAQAVGLSGLAFINPLINLHAFCSMAVLAVIGLATYDTCCDGLVVDITPVAARARVQSLMWTSRFVAATVFTLGYGYWLDWLGSPRLADRLLLASALLTLLPALLVLGLREPKRTAEVERFSWSALRVMVRPWSLMLLAFGGLYGLAGMGVESNISLHYQQMNFGLGGDVGAMGACRNLGRALGAVMVPLALMRFSRLSVLLAGILGLAIAVAGQALVGNLVEAGIVGLAFGAAMGWDDTLFALLAMEAADPRLAASTFALFMAVTNLSVMGDFLFSQGVVIFQGYHIPFFVAALATLATVPLAWPLSQPAPLQSAP